MMQNSTILIVDDEAGVRETLELLLMGGGTIWSLPVMVQKHWQKLQSLHLT